MKDCIFCDLVKSAVIQNEFAYMLWDKYPRSPGHCLIIPKRHSVDFFGTTLEEGVAMLELLNQAKSIVDEKHKPEGYNVLANCGRAADQEVFHTHLHLIPRTKGDNLFGEK